MLTNLFLYFPWYQWRKAYLRVHLYKMDVGLIVIIGSYSLKPLNRFLSGFVQNDPLFLENVYSYK